MYLGQPEFDLLVHASFFAAKQFSFTHGMFFRLILVLPFVFFS